MITKHLFNGPISPNSVSKSCRMHQYTHKKINEGLIGKHISVVTSSVRLRTNTFVLRSCLGCFCPPASFDTGVSAIGASKSWEAGVRNKRKYQELEFESSSERLSIYWSKKSAAASCLKMLAHRNMALGTWKHPFHLPPFNSKRTSPCLFR